MMWAGVGSARAERARADGAGLKSQRAMARAMQALSQLGLGLWLALWRTCGHLSGLLVGALVALIRVYQLLVSPGLPARCRFEPSCSGYAIESLQKHGVAIGLLRSVWRLCRCHPLCRGGYDPP